MKSFRIQFFFDAGIKQEHKECASLQKVVQYAAAFYSLLKGSAKPTAEALELEDEFSLCSESGKLMHKDWGAFKEVRIIEIPTLIEVYCAEGYILEAVHSCVYMIRFPDTGKIRSYSITMEMGGEDFILQARKVLQTLSTISLQLFNIPDAEFPLPYSYSNIADAKRNLQYLCEFCKIAEFQLQDNPAKSW